MKEVSKYQQEPVSLRGCTPRTRRNGKPFTKDSCRAGWRTAAPPAVHEPHLFLLHFWGRCSFRCPLQDWSGLMEPSQNQNHPQHKAGVFSDRRLSVLWFHWFASLGEKVPVPTASKHFHLQTGGVTNDSRFMAEEEALQVYLLTAAMNCCHPSRLADLFDPHCSL